MAILAPGKSDYDLRINALASDFRTGLDRAGDLVTQWGALGATGQSALGYSADDIAQVNALLSFGQAVEVLFAQASAYTAPGGTTALTNQQLLQVIAPFVLPR